MRLLLASKSPARRLTLINAGVDPLVMVSDVDEEAVLAALPGGRAFSGGTTTPGDEVTALAAAKCERVVDTLLSTPADSLPDIPADEDLLVVGCDSMLELEGRMLGKPHTAEVAVRRIRDMRGKTAILWTGHCAALVSAAGRPDSAHPSTHALIASTREQASTKVHFGQMSDAEIEAYVATGEPLHVAGSFTIDGLGGPFISGVEGDHHSVVGISLPLVRRMAADLGVFWPDLWAMTRKR